MTMYGAVAPPHPGARAAAADRLAGLATPAGALGRLGELGVWVSAVQGVCPPEPIENVRAVIFAGITVSGLVSGLGGPQTPWWLWTFATLVLINLLGYFNIDLSARVLVVVMTIEVIIVVVFDIFVFAKGLKA